MTDVDTTARITDPEFASVLMADLLFTRRASERFWNLQRQGRLSTVAPLTGQEAAVVGAGGAP
jgi:TPP-dependent pyruvate/acetoin dehydrogenase alpha subunit